MDYSIRGAAEAAGVSKSTIQRAIKSGKISRKENSRIDASELSRIYPHIAVGTDEYGQSVPHGTDRAPSGAVKEHTEIRVLKAELKAAQQMADERGRTIDDLRTRLDDSERRVTALLSDKRPDVSQGGTERRSVHWIYLTALGLAIVALALLWAFPQVLLPLGQ